MDLFEGMDLTGAAPDSLDFLFAASERRCADSSKLQWDCGAGFPPIESHAEQRVGRNGRWLGVGISMGKRKLEKIPAGGFRFIFF